MEGVEAYGFSAAMSGAFLLSSLLFAAVNRRLREPYMDEIFHVPQAQAYCQGRFLQVGPALGAVSLGHLRAAAACRAYGAKKAEAPRFSARPLPFALFFY